jgi:hypothetical protein
MIKFKPAELFTLVIGLSTTLYAIYLIGMMVTGGNVSGTEIQFMTLLTLINCVNLVHWTPSK